MASPAAILSVLVKTQGARVAAAELTAVNAAAKRTSATMDHATAATDRHRKGLGRLNSGLGAAAKTAVGFVGAYASFHALEGAVKTTEELGHLTLNLHKNFGLTVKSASEWAAVATSRGVAGKQLAQGFKTLSTQAQQAAAGSKQAKKGFEALGVSQEELKKHGNDVNWILRRVSDGLHALPPGAERASITSKLFGRTWQQIAPVLRDGSKAMQETLDKADQYGATFGGKSITSVEDMIKAQREAKLASLGLSVTIGTTLIPVITKVIGGIARFVLAFREGRGSAGQMREGINSVMTALAPFAESVKLIVGWLGRHATVAKILVGVLGGLAIAIWAVNAAMSANPITLVVVALALLAVGLVTAYRKCAVFRDIVDTVWAVLKTGFTWISSNWPLLLAILTGPFGLAALLILKHADAIKGVISGVFNWIKGHWSLLLAILVGPFALAVLLIVKHAHDIKNAVVGAFNAMIGAIKALAGTFVSLGVWVLARIIQGIKSYVGALLAIGKWYYGRLFDGLKAVAGAIQLLGAWTIHRVVDGIRATTSGLLAIGSWLKNRIMDGLRTVKDSIMGLGTTIMDWIVDGLKAGANKLVGFLNSIVGVINKLPGVNIGKIKGFAEGGVNQGNVPRGLARGGAFARTQGVVSSPITMMGEEAPRFPEYVIPTNPAYRKRARGLLGQAAGALGFAQGGTYGFGELEKLWTRAGGNPAAAAIMAHIAQAESGGVPLINNGGYVGRIPGGGVTRAAGLWQILGLPFPGDVYNPLTNARMAIAKSGNGRNLHPWDSSRSAWGRFVGGGGGGVLGAIGGALSGAIGAVGGLAGDLLAKGAGFLLDKLPSTDKLPDWLKGMGANILKNVGSWIKDKVTGLLSQVGGGETSTKGLTPQVKRAVAWARSHGWGGSVTSGFRSRSEQAALYARYLAGGNLAAAPGTSSHEKGQAVDVTDPAGFMRALMNAPANSKLYNRLGARDPVHFSVSGYRKGGVYPYAGSFGGGGVVPGPQGAPSMALVHGGEVIQAAKGIKFSTKLLDQYEAAPFNAATASLALAQAQGDTAAQIANLTTLAAVTYDRIQMAQRILAEGSAVDPNAMTQALAGLVTSLHDAEASLGALTAVPTPDAPDTSATTNLSDNVSDLNDTISRLSDQLEQQRQEALKVQQAFNVSQSQYATLAKAISDVTNGQIGGKVGLGFMTPGFAGGGVRY